MNRKHELLAAEKYLVMKTHEYFKRNTGKAGLKIKGRLRDHVKDCLGFSGSTIPKIMNNWEQYGDPEFEAMTVSRVGLFTSDEGLYPTIRQIVNTRNKATKPTTAQLLYNEVVKSTGVLIHVRKMRRTLRKMGMRRIRGRVRCILAEKKENVAFRAGYLAKKLGNRDDKTNPRLPEHGSIRTKCGTNSLVMWQSQLKPKKGEEDDYHGNFTSALFEKWFSKLCKTLSVTYGACVIRMDGASYHKRVVNPVPTSANIKADIQKWLKKQGIDYAMGLVKAQLLQLVKQFRPAKIYRSTEIAVEYGHKLLFTPPYHPELQPIELVWSQVKRGITDDPASSMEELEEKLQYQFTKVTSTNWVKAFRKVQTYEDKYNNDAEDCILTEESDHKNEVEEDSEGKMDIVVDPGAEEDRKDVRLYQARKTVRSGDSNDWLTWYDSDLEHLAKIDYFRELADKYTAPQLEMHDTKLVRDYLNAKSMWNSRMHQLKQMALLYEVIGTATFHAFPQQSQVQQAHRQRRRKDASARQRSMRRGSSSSAAAGGADPFEEYADAPVELQPKEIDLSGAAEDKLPNTLVVTVIQARALQPAALRSTLSCYVKLSSLGREYKTSVISKSDEPFWNESFSFRAVDWASSVTLSVRDKINVKMRVLGHVQISSADIANLPGMACQSWFRLRDKNGEKREGVESEIELKVALVYTKKNDPSFTSTEIPTAAAAGGEQGDAVIGIIADQDDETEEEAFARRKELERQEKERKSTLYSNLKQGDYQVQVHVIEARDLKGENLSGTSDPYCQVDVMGLKKKTSTKYETLGCVFDEILFFHFKNIGRNELKQATLKIAVWDKEKVLKDKFIGAYHLDCLSVYFRPHHELYRQWIAIHDHMNEKDRGIQGFLLVSVNVIGPGDSFLVHDREAEVAKELTAISSSSSIDASSALLDSNQSIVLMPPTIDLKLHFLLVKVFKAEDLPAMDEGGLVLSSGIDAYVQIGFAANSACKSTAVTVKGASNLSPEFMEEMWIPVLTPTLSRNIVISVWDRDLGRKDEIVGFSTHDYQQVRPSTCPGGIFALPGDRAGKSVLDGDDNDTGDERQEQEKIELRWFNLYGPPLHRVNKKRAAIVSQNPEIGSTYRGRVLLSMEKVESPMPSESEKFHTKRMKDTATSINKPIHPATVKYTLRCALFCGADIPHYNSITTAKTRMRVTISIGSDEMHFDPQPVCRDASVNWEQFKERWPIILPADLTQLPDVVITLSKQLEKDDFVGVSFARVLAADFFVKGFTSKCEWIHLKEDISRRQTKYALDKSQSPGSLLMRIGFGREEISVRHPWGDEVEIFTPFRSLMVHREIRVHIFQFRKLVLPEDKMRLPNPFVSVMCCGQKKKTAPKYKTLDPLFYESLVFTVHVPQDVVFTPDLIFQLHDANVSTSTGVPSGVLGEFVVPMTKAVKSVVNSSAPRPNWYNLQSRSASTCGSSAFIDEIKGEALISIQFVDHTGPIENLYQMDSLTPEYEDANLEIAALGVRRLKALGVLGVQHPYMEFELIGGMFADGTSIRKSKPSAATSNAKNANFLDFIVCPAKLPLDTLYAPQLRVKVCESSLGGLRKATIASCVVDLCTKLPWSVEYVPPQQQRAFENPAPAPAFISSAESDKTKHKMRFPVLKISKQRKATGIQDVASDDGLEGDDDGLLSGNDEDPKATEGGPNNGNEDDGIGIGELKVPQVSLSKSAARGKGLSDPALLKQMQNETQRRYIAAQADMIRGGSHNRGHGGGENTLHDARTADTGSTLKSASYMDGRDWWITEYGGEELENFLKVKALETYPLYRSVLTRPSLLKRKRVRTELRAGLFKGLISVTERGKKKAAEPTKTGGGSSLLDLERLQEPQSLIVRVYVLRGSNLQSKDSNGYSDPYLRLKLGKQVISDRANHKKKTLNPEFFRMFTFNTSLPGPSQLEIGVWDHDLVVDEFIGATTIDLEDRWFHKDWQRIGQGHPKLKDAGGCLKPIEYRHLYTPKRTTSQGFIQLWIDILTSQQAAVLPPINIEPPAPKKFEVRVIVWRAENITDKDNSEVNDYFVKAWMEGGKAESTDVHWRCSNGKPCWNWRFKLPVEYPLRTPEFGRLHIQLWDKDVLKWNDILGEAQLDFYKWIRRAYESNRAVSPFLELKAMSSTSSQEGNLASNSQEQAQGVVNEHSGGGEMDDEDEGNNSDDDSATEDFSSAGFAKENHSLLRNQKKKIPNKPKLPFKKPGFLSKPSADSAKKGKKAKEQAEAKAALNGLLDFLGLGALPDDAEWITIYYTDRESGVSMNMGRIGISVQIVPEQEALTSPVGKGQEAPNLNPYLPPPVGRMRLSANPVMMLKELIGPKMCLRITVLCCCVGCAFFIAVFGATIMSTLTYIQGMSNQENGDKRWQLPKSMRFPPDFQDPKNASVSVGEV